MERRQADLLISPRRKGGPISKAADLTEWEEQQIRKKLRRASENLEEYFSVFSTERGGHLDFNGFGRAIRCVNSVNSRVTNREIKALWATVFDKRDKGYVRVSRVVKWTKNDRNNYVRRKAHPAETQMQKHRYIVLHDFSSSGGSGGGGGEGGEGGKESVGGDGDGDGDGGNSHEVGSSSSSSSSDGARAAFAPAADSSETKGAVQASSNTMDDLFQRGRTKGGSVLSAASSKAYTP